MLDSTAKSSQNTDNFEHDETLRVKKVMPYGWDGSNAVALKTNSAGELMVSGSEVAKKITISGNYIYVGVAPIASAEASAVWQVKRLDKSAGLKVTWKDGDALYNNTATDLTIGDFS